MTRQQLINKLILDNRRRKKRAEVQTVPDEDDRAEPIMFAHQIGDPVFMRFDPEPSPGVVTVLEIHPGRVMYRVMWADIRTETVHHDFELDAWRDKSTRRAK